MDYKQQKGRATFYYETPFWREDFLVIGVDEVGRGALAGPVYAGCVGYRLKSKKELQDISSCGIRDSKMLLPKLRLKLKKIIECNAAISGVGSSDVDCINKLGIVKATELAMEQAITYALQQVKPANIILLVDGRPLRHISLKFCVTQLAIVQGDAKSISIASASILAKVARDAYMQELGNSYQRYAWKANKGYATKYHIEALQSHGICKEHRTLFVRRVMGATHLLDH